MRRLLLFFVANIVFCQCVFAYDFAKIAPSGQTLYYEIISGPGTSGHKVRVARNHPNTLSGNLTIPETVVHNGVTYTVVKIDESAFESCYLLSSVVIPNTVTEIGEKAFYGCRSLSNVEIGNSVEIISRLSFNYCDSITTIFIPSSVQQISGNPFIGCRNLTSISVDASNPWFDSRNNCNAIIMTSSNTLVSGCKNTVIPNTVLIIGGHSFEYCYGLNSIIIPNSVTQIGDLAFYGCRDLNSVTIPNSVVFIGQQSFYGCTGLTSLTIGSSVVTIEASAFGNCYKLLSVDIPNSVSTIGDRAFYLVRNVNYNGASVGAPFGALTLNGYVDGNFVYTTSTKEYLTGYVGADSSVIIPNYVKRIGNAAFSHCVELKSITIPDSVKWIGNFVFDYCNNLSVVIYNAIDCDSIADNDYSHRSFLEGSSDSIKFIIGKKVKKIPDARCSGVTSVILNADSCTAMGGEYYSHGFFSMCELESLEIGSNVKYLPNFAFYNCDINIDTLTIPDSVLTIGRYSLGPGYYVVRIGRSVNKIKDLAFADCNHVSTFISLAEVPPQATAESFYRSNLRLIVPCGTASIYRDAWHDFIWFFSNIIEDCGENPGNEGISNVDIDAFNVYTSNGYIVVENNTHQSVPEVSIIDVMGRLVGTNISTSESTSRITVPMTGLYFVKIGDHPTRKVVVIK